MELPRRRDSRKAWKAGILLYPGKPSIAQALEDARRLARQLHQEQKNQTILRSIVNNSTFGVMVCNAMGEVILFNRAASSSLGFPAGTFGDGTSIRFSRP